MKLDEIVVTSPKEDWNKIELLNAMGVSNYTIRPDGVVDVKDNLYLDVSSNRYLKDGKLGVQFGFVDRHFTSSMKDLKSFEGFPREVNMSVVIFANKDIKSWDGFPRKVGKDVNIQIRDDSTISLVGISEHLVYMHGELEIDWDKVREGGLELLNVGGHPYIKTPTGQNLPRPFQIIAEHLRRQIQNGDSEIFACQSQLIEEGFEEFAKM